MAVPTRSPVTLQVVCPISRIGQMEAKIGINVGGRPRLWRRTPDMTILPPLTPAVPTDKTRPRKMN